jgi:DNA-binding transcriptional regulator YhcF (GntR family)
MSRIIVDPKNEDELNSLSEYLEKNGIHFITEDEFEFEKQMEARKKLAELVETFPKIDITDEEIDEIVEKVRAERYEQKNKNNS